MKHPEWSKHSVIYEMNIRQFTIDGTFKAAEAHLQRIKDLGVEIIWIMPIYPIGEEDRKGVLGSYYSIKDYTSINPEFGSISDFSELVDAAKSLGLRVIIDWVANHTSRDAVWVNQHPDWYKRDELGNIIAPYDWSDVAQLDTHNRNMWAGMSDVMKFWLKNTNIDGFRCDMASLLPVDFWNYIRLELDRVRPVFMLAESEDPYLHHSAFNVTYCWEFHHLLNGLAQEKNTVDDLVHYFNKQEVLFDRNDMRMAFTSNHDENTWSGTEFERMGLAAKQMAILTFLIPSIPLIYNGQEVALSHRLSFFEKDMIEWDVNLDFTLLYKKLCMLKKEQEALWNGDRGGEIFLFPDVVNKTVKIERRKDDSIVVAYFNFSYTFASVQVPQNAAKEYLTNIICMPGAVVPIGPWQSLIFVK